MIKSLGEKIKAARKELKMTQSDLAQPEMTKSMLSQIENNQAMPSMKNLQHIAQKLGKPVSYFLDDVPSLENQASSLPIETIAESLKEISELLQKRELVLCKEKLESILHTYHFDEPSKIYGDILYKYGECLMLMTQFSEGEEKIREACRIYESQVLYAEAAKAYSSLYVIPWSRFEYEACLTVVENTMIWYHKAASRDINFEIEMYQITAVCHFAMGDMDKAYEALSKAIDIYNESKVYYLADETYKLCAMIFLLQERYDDFLIHIEKAKQFAEVTENKRSMTKLLINYAVYENEIGNYSKAFDYLKRYKENGGDSQAYYYNNLMAQSQYHLGKYDEALESIRKIKLPEFALYKYDYLYFWVFKAYEGLIYFKLGDTAKAEKSILEGIEKLEVFHDSKELAFAYRSLSEVYEGTGDFEKAYYALKKACNIKNPLKKSK